MWWRASLTEGPVWEEAGRRTAILRFVHRRASDGTLEVFGHTAERIATVTGDNVTTLDGSYRIEWTRGYKLVRADNDQVLIRETGRKSAWLGLSKCEYLDAGGQALTSSYKGRTALAQVMEIHLDEDTLAMSLRWLPPVRRATDKQGLCLGEAAVHPGVLLASDPVLLSVFAFPMLAAHSTPIESSP
jgi:hypothetical protein